MPNFLALSRELRDLIYNFVLHASDDPPPSSPADSGERQLSCDEVFHGCKMYFSPHPVHISSTALLLTNRQIHAEFAPWIARLKKSGRLRYKLDCMLYEQESVYPTWLSVPVMSAHVDVLEVDLRLFGDPEGFNRGLMSEWHQNYLGHSPIIWCLWALIERFLTGGPDLSSCGEEEPGVKVESLVVNVIDTAHPGEYRIGPWDWSRDGTMHSNMVVREIQGGYLLLAYSPPILERLKTIVLCDDGKEYERWELEALPARRNY